jgi:FKBP-type peptidyl-prolyl cis-trans isomerase
MWMRRVCGACGVFLLLSLGCVSDQKDSGKENEKPKKYRPPREVTTDSEGYSVTKSGLKYKDLKVGEGTEAEPGDIVTVHYTGTLTDGTKFDSSVDRNKPFSFPLGAGRVIRGWDEGVDGMKVGGKRKLVIPYDLGYGEEGSPPKIPPKATLLFDVELLKVMK